MQFCNQYNQLDQRLYHRQAPNPLPNPVIGHFNHQVAEHIGWSQDVNLMTNWVDIIAGQHIPDGFAPPCHGVCWASIWTLGRSTW